MIHSQEQHPLSLPGPPPPRSPFAYEPLEDPLGEYKVETGESLFVTNGASATIESHLEKPSGTSSGTLQEASTVIGPAPMIIEVTSKDSAPSRLTGLFFTIAQNETGDMTFSNEGQDVPLKMTIVAHATTGKMTMRLSLTYTGLNVQHALDGAKFFHSLVQGGEFRLIVQPPGMEIEVTALRGKIPTGTNVGPDSRAIKLFEQLVFIQNLSGAALTVPEGGISPEDAQNIRVVARILGTGLATYRTPSWEITVGLEQAKGLLRTYSEREFVPIVMDAPAEQMMKVLDVDILLGPKIIGVKRTFIAADDLERLRHKIEASNAESIINATISTDENCPIEEHYMRWLPVEHAAAIYRMVIFKKDSPEEFLGRLLYASHQRKNTSPNRFAELLSALRKNVGTHEAGSVNPIVTASNEELMSALSKVMKDAPEGARFDMAVLLLQHEVLSMDEAARFAGVEQTEFLRRSRSVGEAVHDLNEDEIDLSPVDVERAVTLLQSWCVEDPREQQEQRETWEYLKTALDEDRLSDRKLFA